MALKMKTLHTSSQFLPHCHCIHY